MAQIVEDLALQIHLARPLEKLRSIDTNGLLRRTLLAWFSHNVQPGATARALFIHRNTLEYRLNRISELTGLDLGNFDDRLRQVRMRIALGNYFPGPGGIARSWRTARTTMSVGKQRMPEQRSFFYQDLVLPVLLDSLRGGWQASELLGVDSAMSELQQLQTLLTTPDRDNLIAIVSLTEMVVLKPALNAHGRYDHDDHRRRVDQLLQRMKESVTAEMMLEQARLLHLLAQDSRLREELVLNLIRSDTLSPTLNEWAQRLGIDLNQPRVVAVVEVDSGQFGELHEGALLVLSQGRVVDIDEAVAKHLHGVRPGVNLPLRIEGSIVGVIGLTGEPAALRHYGELVCYCTMSAVSRMRILSVCPLLRK
ncbi:hypothetical protein CRX72_09585 [Pantoea sp. BRM17]|nr:hypothetical protein CRX72_09585 [Pantoea sp. BRM17]